MLLQDWMILPQNKSIILLLRDLNKGKVYMRNIWHPNAKDEKVRDFCNIYWE